MEFLVGMMTLRGRGDVKVRERLKNEG